MDTVGALTVTLLKGHACWLAMCFVQVGVLLWASSPQALLGAGILICKLLELVCSGIFSF